MANTFSGKGGDRRETPTLRKWLAANASPPPEKYFFVQLIFDSQKFGAFTLVTERFKLPVYEDNPIFHDLKLFCVECMDRESGIAISITAPEELGWDIVEVEGEIYSWESEAWGYRAKHTGKTRSQKTSKATEKPKGRS